MLEVLSKMYGRAILRRLKNANHPNHMRPARRRRFYLAVLIERLTFAPRYDISCSETLYDTSVRMRFMRTPIAHRCVGLWLLSRRAPVENSALSHSYG